MNIKIFSPSEFDSYLFKYYKSDKKIKELESNIRFFDSIDSNYLIFASAEFVNSLKYIVLVKGASIIGIAKIAVYENNKSAVSCSYISIHKEYRNKGYSKLLIDAMFTCIKTNSIYDNKVFSTSSYTPSGFKYLRNSLLTACEKHNIKFKDNYVKYPDSETKEGYSEDFFNLVKLSKELYKQKYPDECIF